MTKKMFVKEMHSKTLTGSTIYQAETNTELHSAHL